MINAVTNTPTLKLESCPPATPDNCYTQQMRPKTLLQRDDDTANASIGLPKSHTSVAPPNSYWYFMHSLLGFS